MLAHDSAAALDPEANAATPDALTSELPPPSFLLLLSFPSPSRVLTVCRRAHSLLPPARLRQRRPDGADGCKRRPPLRRRLFTPPAVKQVRLRCRELSSIGGDDPSAVIGAVLQEAVSIICPVVTFHLLDDGSRDCEPSEPPLDSGALFDSVLVRVGFKVCPECREFGGGVGLELGGPSPDRSL